MRRIALLSLLLLVLLGCIITASAVTRDEAVEWLKSWDGTTGGINLPATNYGYQCTDFVSGYMNWLVFGDVYKPQSEGGYVPYAPSYYPTVAGWNTARWEVIANYAALVPEPGDIFISNAHVGVVVSSTAATAYVVEQNTRSGYNDTTGTLPWYHQITWTSKGSGAYGVNYFIRYKQFTTAPVEVRGSYMQTGYSRELPDGDYMIASAADIQYYLDIAGGAVPAANHDNVDLWHTPSGIGDCDAWTIKYKDGFYEISQYGSNMCMDVPSGSTLRGENIQVWPRNGEAPQQWAISRFPGSKGYRIQARSSGYSLDIEDGDLAAGTNVRQWTDNDSNAQCWVFIPYKPVQPIQNGRYVLLAGGDRNFELDVPGDTGDISNGTSMRIWSDASDAFREEAYSRYNSFDVEKLSNGYYKLTHVASGKVLEVPDGSSKNGADVTLYDNNGSYAQQWAITPQVGKSGYVLRARCSGMTLDLLDGNLVDGQNVRQCYYNWSSSSAGVNAQSWYFEKAEYTVSYTANGGENAPQPQTKYYNGDLKLSEQIPTKEGYTFLGWAYDTQILPRTPDIQPGAIYKKNADMVFHAIWKYDPVPTPSDDTTESTDATENTDPTDEPTDTTTPADDPTDDTTPSDDTTPVDDPIEATTPADDSTDTTAPAEKPTEATTPADDTTDTTTPVEKPTENTTPVDDTTDTTTPVEKPTENTTPADIPTDTTTPAEKPTENSTPVDDTTDTTTPADTTTPVENPTDTTTPTDHSTDTTTPTDNPTDNSAPAQNPTDTTPSTDDSTNTTTPLETPVDTTPSTPDSAPAPVVVSDPEPAVKVITVTKNTTVDVEAYQTYRVEVVGRDVLAYKSGSAKVATVSGDGVIQTLTKGKAKITMTCADKKKLTLTLRVSDPYLPTKIALEQGAAMTLGVGESLQLTPALTPASAHTTLTWSVSGKAASVDANGVVTTLSIGKATVNVRTANGKKAKIKLTVVDPNAPSGIRLSTESKLTLYEGQSAQIVASAVPATATQAITWTSSKPAIASVDENGVVTAIKPGKANITAKTVNGKKVTVKVNVTKGDAPTSKSAPGLSIEYETTPEETEAIE